MHCFPIHVHIKPLSLDSLWIQTHYTRQSKRTWKDIHVIKQDSPQGLHVIKQDSPQGLHVIKQDSPVIKQDSPQGLHVIKQDSPVIKQDSPQGLHVINPRTKLRGPSHQLAVRMRIMRIIVPRMRTYTCIACV